MIQKEMMWEHAMLHVPRRVQKSNILLDVLDAHRKERPNLPDGPVKGPRFGPSLTLWDTQPQACDFEGNCPCLLLLFLLLLLLL